MFHRQGRRSSVSSSMSLFFNLLPSQTDSPFTRPSHEAVPLCDCHSHRRRPSYGGSQLSVYVARIIKETVVFVT
jgi:hypothetical protein